MRLLPAAPRARVALRAGVGAGDDGGGGGGGDARLSTLSAPDGFGATHGLTLAGQTFDGSAAGELVGEFAPLAIARADDGTYAFDLAPGTAALLELP